MIEKYRKRITALLAIFLLLIYVAYPALSLAQEVTPTDTPTPTQTIDNSATVTTTTTTTSDTGNNAINPTPTDTPTPTPDPTQTITDPSITPTDTPTPTPEITIDGASTSANSAQVNNNLSSNSNSGDNLATDSAQLDATNSASENNPEGSSNSQSNGANTNTGNATSITSLQNDVNATSISSKLVYQTINLFVDQNGNINLSDPFTIAANAVQSHPDDPVVNVSVTDINNYAYLANDVVSFANSGQNTINGGDALINTGNSYSIVSLLNNVNFTVVNSDIHLITINIFGNLNGNIILPNLPAYTSTNCSGCGMSTVTNDADLINNVSSTANSGTNTINGSGSITTGNATSIINNFNLVNTTLFGTSAQVLYINNFGTWSGNFIGWDGFSVQTGGASLVFYNTTPTTSVDNSCNCSTDTNINNNAIVTNNITSTANTGENSITGKSGTISTGNAYSVVSLFNFINSTFINSVGFLGFVNIFGNWTGNIGGQKEFDALNSPQDNIDNQNNQNTSTTNFASSNVKESGGKLEVTSSNNVGAFVYPGDTVTFFVKVKNTGTGKVYGTKLDLYLIRDGKAMGGTTFDLGDIDAGHSKTLTTGFILSKNAPEDEYIAQADTYGTVGPDNEQVDASSQNTFKIKSKFGTIANIEKPNNPPAVLGTQHSDKTTSKAESTNGAFYTLIAVILTYVTLRTLRQRKQLREIFVKNITFKEKLVAFRMFLL